MGSPAVVSDPYAAIATPVAPAAPGDPYASLAAPVTPPSLIPSSDNAVQKVFDKANVNAPDASFPEKVLNRTAQGIEFPFVHPLEFGKSILQGIGESPDYPELPITLPNGQKQLPPVTPIRARMDEFGNEWDQSPSTAIANVGGDVASGVLMGKLGSTILTPAEASLHGSTRELVKELNPEAAPRYLADFPRVAPDVQDFIRRSNTPLTTAEGLGNAMAGRADELSEHFKNQIYDPIAADQVTLPRALATNIRTLNEGGNVARLADVQGRISQLNRELAPSYEAGTITSAEKVAKQAELTGLTDFLYKTISNKTGIPVEQIADLRQRTGILNKLAGRTTDADAAILTGSRGSGQLPRSKFAAASKFVDSLMGGASKAADKKVSGIVNKLPEMEAAPLPVPNPSAIPPPTIAPRFLRTLPPVATPPTGLPPVGQ